MKTSRRPRIAVAALAATITVLVTGCSQSTGTTSEPTTPDPTASESTSPGDAKVKANTAYIDLWEEFASFYAAANEGDIEIARTSTAADVNTALGWDEESLAAFVSFDKDTGCLVSLDGVYLSVGKSSVDMDEGIDCPADTSKARVRLLPSDDFESFVVIDGADLLPSGTFIADVDYTATSGSASAVEAVKAAATVIEAAVVADPDAQISPETVKATLVETEDFTGKVNLSWIEPQSDFDLGYDLCVALPDGSWASWDSATSKVKDAGDLGGCPA